MDSIVMQGGKPIIGDIYISGSKNASLPLMTVSLLTDEDFAAAVKEGIVSSTSSVGFITDWSKTVEWQCRC